MSIYYTQITLLYRTIRNSLFLLYFTPKMYMHLHWHTLNTHSSLVLTISIAAKRYEYIYCMAKICPIHGNFWWIKNMSNPATFVMHNQCSKGHLIVYAIKNQGDIIFTNKTRWQKFPGVRCMLTWSVCVYACTTVHVLLWCVCVYTCVCVCMHVHVLYGACVYVCMCICWKLLSNQVH